MYFQVTEFARVGPHRQIQVRDHGWMSTTGLQPAEVALATISRSELEELALNFLLPDDAEETGELQDWGMIQRKLARYGVEATIDELKDAPVVIEIEESLRQMLAD
ncbi:hypothetical protein [Pseudonocardia sp. ICBG1293]|uniref:hypothetical protein n=1 Tax=Pseudonocardia sp. ICBG1293 TaxID=2844382 RepID=UPI001CCF9AC7|nr:hypothetical protein [Pseudonocardia sp. ICBG1293]